MQVVSENVWPIIYYLVKPVKFIDKFYFSNYLFCKKRGVHNIQG